MKIKLTYEQIKARKIKLEQDKRELEQLLAPKKTLKGLIEVEADEDMEVPKKTTVDTEKVNQELQKVETKLQKWAILEEQHRPEPKHFIDEMLEGLPDDTELYQDLQQAKEILK